MRGLFDRRPLHSLPVVWNAHVSAGRCAWLDDGSLDALRERKTLSVMDPNGAAVVEYRPTLTGTNKESQKTLPAAVAQLGVRLLTELGSDDANDAQFDQPSWIAVDGSGRVYVVDTGNNRVQVFESVA